MLKRGGAYVCNVKMRSKILYASDRIKTCLNAFFSTLLQGKLGKNTRYGSKALTEALHRMLYTGSSLSATAESMGLAHTTLTRKLQQVTRDQVWEALSTVMDPLLGVERDLLVVDFTHLQYTGKDLLRYTTGTTGGDVFKLLAAASGGSVCYLAHKSMLDWKEDLLQDLLGRAGSGRILVADGEFGSKKCMKRLWEAVDTGLLEGFVVRGNPRWHRLLYRFQGAPLGLKKRARLWGREVWVYKARLGDETGYLISSSPDLGPREYRARWSIEVYFRDAKDLLPRMCLHTLPARLAVFAACVAASGVLRLHEVSKGAWRSVLTHLSMRALSIILDTPGLHWLLLEEDIPRYHGSC